MMNFSQGDIIKISNLKDAMLVVSKNEFIKKTGVFHVCPLLEDYAEGPLHIKVRGVKDTSGTAICEQLKLIDPSARKLQTYRPRPLSYDYECFRRNTGYF